MFWFDTALYELLFCVFVIFAQILFHALHYIMKVL